MNDGPLARYLVPIRRWWWIVVGLTLLAAGLAWVTQPTAGFTEEEIADPSTDFRATHILVRNDDAPTQLAFDLILLLADQGDLTNRVVDAMGGVAGTSDVEAVELEADAEIGTLTITAVENTPDEAATLASTYADELVDFLDERSIDSIENDLASTEQRIEGVRATIDELEAELAELPEGDPDRQLLEAELQAESDLFGTLRSQQRSLEDQLAGGAPSFETIQEPSPVPADATAGPIPLPTNPALRIGAAALAGLLGGIALVLAIDYLDTRVRTRRQAEEAFGLPVVAELPYRYSRDRKSQPLPARDDPGGVSAEVIRALRLSVSLAPAWHLSSFPRNGGGPVGTKTAVELEQEPSSIVVTSPRTGDGKSTLVANLAVSLAEGGKRVVVIDCDFRRPAVGELLGVAPGRGLRELTHATERPLGSLTVPTNVTNVAMIRSGSPGYAPPWFLAESYKLVDQVLSFADVAIFDTGPITLTNEASSLLPHVDTSLMVARAGKVATDQARDAVEQLSRVGARVTGVVLVASETRRRYGYGYYGPSPGRSSAPTGESAPVSS